MPHTVEEAYELADAAGRGDDAKLLDELGDVLFQVHFLALLLEERGAGGLADVADGMVAKLIRRHPHVFEESEARDLLEGDPSTAREVLSNWDRIKQEVEGRGAGDPFADVPPNLPALLYARKVQRRAASAGLGRPRARRVARRLRSSARPTTAASAAPCSSSSTRPAGWASTPSWRCAPRPSAFATRPPAAARSRCRDPIALRISGSRERRVRARAFH